MKMRRQTIGTGTYGRKMTYEQLQEAHNIVVGSPETVIKKLQYVINRLQPGYLLIYGNEGPMPHKDVLRSIELSGKEVIPGLKAE
jgi:alkanesulfonate monooxygenase SsuD/methylene tetrahydromethanopterin reductase-like flavin-dependent oxidoreductase (luciferase family)